MHLHERHVHHQDVSLENQFLCEDHCLKLVDMGQAVRFTVDNHGDEEPVDFEGPVGKTFCRPYCSTMVDAWCSGWCGIVLLNGEPIFHDTP